MDFSTISFVFLFIHLTIVSELNCRPQILHGYKRKRLDGYSIQENQISIKKQQQLRKEYVSHL